MSENTIHLQHFSFNVQLNLSNAQRERLNAMIHSDMSEEEMLVEIAKVMIKRVLNGKATMPRSNDESTHQFSSADVFAHLQAAQAAEQEERPQLKIGEDFSETTTQPMSIKEAQDRLREVQEESD